MQTVCFVLPPGQSGGSHGNSSFIARASHYFLWKMYNFAQSRNCLNRYGLPGCEAMVCQEMRQSTARCVRGLTG
jgi:hypothetical protein